MRPAPTGTCLATASTRTSRTAKQCCRRTTRSRRCAGKAESSASNSTMPRASASRAASGWFAIRPTACTPCSGSSGNGCCARAEIRSGKSHKRKRPRRRIRITTRSAIGEARQYRSVAPARLRPAWPHHRPRCRRRALRHGGARAVAFSTGRRESVRASRGNAGRQDQGAVRGRQLRHHPA